MRNMTLWTASGITMAAASLITSGGDAGETVRWLVDLCLTGPADPDMPMIAMEEHDRHIAPALSAGFGVLSVALIAGGLWPGRKAAEETPPADPDRMLAAMTYAATATGGISLPELCEKVRTATGIELSPEEARAAMAAYRADAPPEKLAWIGEGQNKAERATIMRAALGVAWTHGDFTPGGLEMIGHLAEALGQSGEDLALLFWEVSEPPASEQDDPLRRLRPNSRIVRGEETPAMA